MSDILEKNTAYKIEEVRQARDAMPLRIVAEYARSAERPRGFVRALRDKHALGAPALIAEIKRASPSKGLIREDFDPVTLANAYQSGGAACLSVLTDTPSFQGAPEYLTSARSAVAIPALRKDFMIDTYQVVQARAWGADCILIILAQVDDQMAADLLAAARDWGMDALIEVHDKIEMERALTLDGALIGSNNRCLRTFETRLETTEELAGMVGPEKIVVSESGIFSHDDIARLGRFNVKTFLVGESLMRQNDVEAATRNLLGEGVVT